MDLSPTWAGKGHGAGKKAERWRKRAWRWEKGAWRGAMLKGAGGNTIYRTKTDTVKRTYFVCSLISGASP